MKLILFISLFFLSTFSIYCQWINQYSNNDVYFYSVYFTNEDNGFAVGTNSSYTSGIIYKTTDGGNDWVNIPGFGNNLYSVYFPTTEIGLAVGSAGTVVKTTDGGGSWTERQSGTTKTLNSIYFINTTTGFAVGGHNTDGIVIIKTTDQGETWIDKSFSVPGVLREVHFIDNDIGWVVGRQQQDLGGGTYIDNEIIYKTTDGGEIWMEKLSEINDCRFETVYFKDATTGWVGGASEYNYPNEPWVVLLKTTDGGDNWTPQISNKHGITVCIRFCDETVGWASGRGDQWSNQYALNYKTTDGGSNWIHQTDLNNIWLNSMYFVNPNTGWGTSTGRIHKYQTATGVEEENISLSDYSLNQNFPNPFNSNTKITYSIPQYLKVTIKVLDMLGSELEILVNEDKSAGNYEVEFDANKLPSGIYFYELRAGAFVETKKMVLLK